MNAVQSSVKRVILSLSLAVFLLFTINIFLAGIYIYRHQKSVSDEMPVLPLLRKLAKGLVFKDDRYLLNHKIKNELDKQGMWAMLLDDRSGNVLWSYRKPEEIPVNYTLSDIARISRYYLQDYPVSTWKHTEGLIVLGSAKDSLVKVAYTIPYAEFKAMPGWLAIIVICDLLILFLFYFIIDRKSIKSVDSVLSGIQSLAAGKTFKLTETGAFSELATQLNQTSDLLETRSIAQENWIAGVSHDIRTPLSIILGYAEKIETNSSLPDDVQENAALIKFQGMRLRDLVNDLNLITRLGDGTQALRQDLFRPAVFCRELIASLLNSGLPAHYTIEPDIDKEAEPLLWKGDAHLLQRAVNNLLYNSIRHNPKGCEMQVKLYPKEQQILLLISDNGKGMTSGEIEILQSRSHYLANNDALVNGQHGLGLYIVQQIVKMHLGEISFQIRKSGGLEVRISLPYSGCQPL